MFSIDIVLIVLLSVLIVLVIILLVKSFLKKESISPQIEALKNELTDMKTKQLESQNKSLLEQQQLFQTTQQNLNNQLKNIMTGVNNSQSNITSSLRQSNSVIQDIQKKLGTLEATAQNIQEIGKDISSLQEILQAPKLRGNLGEYMLEELLKDILPRENFEIQHSFKDNTKVDAIIKLRDGIVPVDSKFPLESFQRLISSENETDKKKFKKEFTTSVKARIDEIANKYIKPSEGTFEFGMMYIPAENVFYEIIISDSLSDKQYEILNYAISKHVIPVSPNTFYAYLMAIVYGLKGFKIEQEAKTITKQLSAIQTSFGSFYNDFQTLGTHINRAESKFSELNKAADKINDKVNQITGAQFELGSSEKKLLD
ncbi:MAG: DNA recombination protein RmuC [Treponema sp.]|nr:DNA recombination protein RmuC [Treponema sp.]